MSITKSMRLSYCWEVKKKLERVRWFLTLALFYNLMPFLLTKYNNFILSMFIVGQKTANFVIWKLDNPKHHI